MPPSKLAREYFAVFTTIFFAWLLGPSEVNYPNYITFIYVVNILDTVDFNMFRYF